MGQTILIRHEQTQKLCEDAYQVAVQLSGKVLVPSLQAMLQELVEDSNPCFLLEVFVQVVSHIAQEALKVTSQFSNVGFWRNTITSSF